jgi:hypothetical protein
LDLSDPALQGQILQFGFSTIASNFEGAGNFYDNASFGLEDCGSGGGPGPGGELAVNGDFETGDDTGWSFFDNGGTFVVTSAQANGGSFSGNVNAPAALASPLIKQANIGIGTVQPNSQVDISFDLFGSLTGAGGTWTTYSYSVTTGPDVSGGVTLQLKAACGGDACTVDAYFDNVTVTIP